MKIKIAGKLSTMAGVALLTLAVSASPALYAQESGEVVAPAQVVDQLLSKVEHDLVPLAEAMPANKYNFAPTNGEFTGVANFGDQIRHVIHANYYMFGDAASMKPTVPGKDQLKTKEQLVQALKDSFAFGHQAADTLGEDNALETVKPVAGVDTRAGIMLFAIIHMNDHYGQLVEYLRMNGIVPPASRHSNAPPSPSPTHANPQTAGSR